MSSVEKQAHMKAKKFMPTISVYHMLCMPLCLLPIASYKNKYMRVWHFGPPTYQAISFSHLLCRSYQLCDNYWSHINVSDTDSRLHIDCGDHVKNTMV